MTVAEDVADRLLRDVERHVLEDRERAGRAGAEEVRVGAPAELVVGPGQPLVRHHAVHPEHQEEDVGGREHRLAPREGRADRAPLRLPGGWRPPITTRDDDGAHECDHTTSFVISLTMTVPGAATKCAPVRAGLARTFWADHIRQAAPCGSSASRPFVRRFRARRRVTRRDRDPRAPAPALQGAAGRAGLPGGEGGRGRPPPAGDAGAAGEAPRPRPRRSRPGPRPPSPPHRRPRRPRPRLRARPRSAAGGSRTGPCR